MLGAAPAAEQQSSCSRRGFVFPGGGPLEWKPTRKFKVRVQGFAGEPLAVTGRTLIVSGVRSIAGKRRHGVAAIDMRTGRVLPFDPVIPANHFLLAVAASPTTVYVAHGPDGLGLEVDAFRLPSGAPLASFSPPDFRNGHAESLVYAGGSVIIGGSTGRLADHARRVSPDDRRPALAAEPSLQGAGDRDRRVAPVHRDPSR